MFEASVSSRNEMEWSDEGSLEKRCLSPPTRPADPRLAIRNIAYTAIPRRRGYSCGAAPSSDLLDQLHLRAVWRGHPAHMPTVVDALFEDLRAVLLKVRKGAGVIVGLDRDVFDADMLLMILK